MLSIRKNMFETNSSSTHCLVLNSGDINSDIDEEIFLKKYKINFDKSPTIIDNDMDGGYFKSIEDKLAYFSQIICMYSFEERYDEETVVGKFFSLLRKIFKNTDFGELYVRDQNYFYEDGDWLLTEGFRGEINIEPFLDESNLKRLFQYGIIYFGNRDDEAFYEFIHVIKNKDDLIVEVSG